MLRSKTDQFQKKKTIFLKKHTKIGTIQKCHDNLLVYSDLKASHICLSDSSIVRYNLEYSSIKVYDLEYSSSHQQLITQKIGLVSCTRQLSMLESIL